MKPMLAKVAHKCQVQRSEPYGRPIVLFEKLIPSLKTIVFLIQFISNKFLKVDKSKE